MNKILKKIQLLLIGIILVSTPGFSQQSIHDSAKNCDEDGYCWGENREDSRRQYTMYSDYYSFGEEYWKEGEPHLDWLITNVPYLNQSIYINGYKIYDHLIKEEKDESKKAEYQDKLLALLDNRMIYFGEEEGVLQRKGMKAYPFLVKRGSGHYEELFQLYSSILSKSGEGTNRANLLYLMSTVKINFKTGKIGEKEVLGIYDKISAVISANLEKTEGDENQKWEETENKVDQMLSSIIQFDCETLQSKFGADIAEGNLSLVQSKKLLKYLMQAKCFDDELFLVAAQNVYQKEPSPGIASTLSKKYFAQKDYKASLYWYDEAIKQSEGDELKSGEFYLEKARVLAVVGKYTEAREYSQKAVLFNPSLLSDAYLLIGDLYMNSGNYCEEKNPVQQRTIYLAAFDAYEKAGNSEKMQFAEAQFPSIQEIFSHGFKEGNKIEIGCWIGGTTIIRRRPSENQ
ncbi:tetratricopeptide repeat protein [Flexithrix dorotheae]|uniref:tetratricopeptide repeat protein n=1 Tax=Flexithrix dorotheae TaxID=70993 RepID=UPI00035C25DB|nr:tetratricopeptide repeat protein [Flexithrix dorotheae]